MICRKCGAELPDNVIRCNNCGIKVNMHCPKCGTLNIFGTKHCKNCGFELIKICPYCGSSNVYSAEECRKCHMSFDIQKENNENNEIKKKNEESEIVRPFSLRQAHFINTEIPNNNTEYFEDVNTNINSYETISNYSQREDEIERIFNIDGVFLDDKSNQEIQDNEKENIQNKQETFEQTNENDIELVNDNIEIEPLEEITDIDIHNSIENEPKEEENTDEQTETKSDNIPAIEIQEDAVNKAIHTIKTSITKHIIAVNGAEGSGKSAVLKQTCDYLSTQGYASLYGSCTPLVQITSFGFFQDAFLRMMGFPPYTTSTESFIKDFKKSNFARIFTCLTGNELTAFLNIFYPSQKDNFENILDNKMQIFSILEKVIKSFLVNSNLIISIDNFELLDGASYDFIVYMLQKGYFNNRLKLFVAYQENKSIQSYFDLTNLDESIFETIVIKKFEKEDLIKAVNKTAFINIAEILDDNYIEDLVQKADGNAIRMEQEIALLFDTKYISIKDNDILLEEENKPEINPVSFEELIKLRLNTLSPSAKNVLFMAAIMGYRFAVNILCLSVTMPVKKAEKIIEFLKQELFITSVDNYTCEFKSLTLWKLIYKEAKRDLLYKENSQRLYLSLKPLILSSNLQKLISCSEALNKNEEFLIWQNTANITAKLGDTNLYVIAQKQSLKLLDEIEINNSEEIKSQIYEEIGKLLCEKSPKEAITYLANVLDSVIKESDIRKIIDLSGYFVKSCYLTGNYFGANEAVDAIITSISTADVNVSPVDISLIKTRKLKALINIGNSEQVINLVNEDIIPTLEKGLYSRQISTRYKHLLINAWLLSKFSLAKAYALQGNPEVFNIIEQIRQFTEKYEYNNRYYISEINLTDAFANTVSGDINKSNEILNNISNSYRNKNMETNLLAEWNLINIINRVLSGQKNDLKVDLFELAAFTNNINEHFIKNIIKLILGYVLKEEGNVVKALEIFNEEITYFAKEKVAIGALLSWALIVKITMDMGDDDKALNTANKSLEIAQSPKINNYFFIIYFQKFIAEIYMRKGDLTATKMYLEKALMLAKQYNLRYQLIELYIAYAKYMEAFMSSKKTYSSEYIKVTSEMYTKALNLAKELKLNNLIEFTTRERSSFKTFCQLNSIEL